MAFDSHPCFSQGCAGVSGRIHLPVSPECNIRCRFCARAISRQAARPGNAARVVSPDEAMNILKRALLLCPELAVVGVAGPGDPLASHHACQTLLRAHQLYPKLMTCLSSNGLGLMEYLPRLLAAGVETLTVTVNAVDPDILSRLCAGVVWEGRFISGVAGCLRLIAAQSQGIQAAREAGIAIKVNMVLAPEFNGRHVEMVARTACAWGASLINIIPLLPAGQMARVRPPDAAELEEARMRAEDYLPVMRGCRRCRADACGVPGVSDYARRLYRDFGPVETFSHG
jgi:nitrogen fixation protein NifB